MADCVRRFLGFYSSSWFWCLSRVQKYRSSVRTIVRWYRKLKANRDHQIRHLYHWWKEQEEAEQTRLAMDFLQVHLKSEKPKEMPIPTKLKLAVVCDLYWTRHTAYAQKFSKWRKGLANLEKTKTAQRKNVIQLEKDHQDDVQKKAWTSASGQEDLKSPRQQALQMAKLKLSQLESAGIHLAAPIWRYAPGNPSIEELRERAHQGMNLTGSPKTLGNQLVDPLINLAALPRRHLMDIGEILSDVEYHSRKFLAPNIRDASELPNSRRRQETSSRPDSLLTRSLPDNPRTLLSRQGSVGDVGASAGSASSMLMGLRRERNRRAERSKQPILSQRVSFQTYGAESHSMISDSPRYDGDAEDSETENPPPPTPEESPDDAGESMPTLATCPTLDNGITAPIFGGASSRASPRVKRCIPRAGANGEYIAIDKRCDSPCRGTPKKSTRQSASPRQKRSAPQQERGVTLLPLATSPLPRSCGVRNESLTQFTAKLRQSQAQSRQPACTTSPPKSHAGRRPLLSILLTSRTAEGRKPASVWGV